MCKELVISFVLLILVDALYLRLNAQKFNTIVKDISGQSVTRRYYSAALVYVALAVGLTYLIKPTSAKDAFVKGALFGLVAYSVFDFTAHFMFEKWDLKTATIDAVWGGILCGVVSLIKFKAVH